MQQLKKQSLADQVYVSLLEQIQSGRIEAGQRLVIDHLAKEFGVSLIPVREALARLNAQGIVEYISNQGFRVAPEPEAEEYEKLFTARLVIEYGSLHTGFAKVDKDFIDRLDQINHEIAKINQDSPEDAFESFVNLNDQFHMELVTLSGSPRLLEAYDKIGYGPNIGRRMYTEGVPDIENNIREHARIIDALRTMNEQAALKALEDHIQEGLSRFKNNMSSR